MKIKFFRHCFPALPVIAAAIIIFFGVNLPCLHAQAPAAGGPPPLAPTAANMKGRPASDFYKNLKVLKDIPAGEIHPAMEYITTALGVPCEYCHVFPNLDSDERREKNVARSMMKMTIALNATVFDGKREITCFTCHRGATKGASTLAFPGETAPIEKTATDLFPVLAVRNITNLDSSMSPSKAPATVVSGAPAASKPMAAPVSLPTVDEVFSKYAQALGGSAAIGKIHSLVEKGTVETLVPPPPPPKGVPPSPPAMGILPAEIDRKLPGKVLLAMQFPGRPRMEGVDDEIGWTNAPLREKTGGELVLEEEFAEFPAGLKFEESHSKVQVDAIEKIGDREAYRVVGTRPDGSTIDRLYFDVQSGLLLRSNSTMQSILGAFPEETNYDDYRDAGGIKVPFKMHVLNPLEDEKFTWSQVNLNAPVEDSRFKMPPPPPPKPAAD